MANAKAAMEYAAKIDREAMEKRLWVGLTDDEIKDTWSQLWYELNHGEFASDKEPKNSTVMFAKFVEAKLKEKNG